MKVRTQLFLSDKGEIIIDFGHVFDNNRDLFCGGGVYSKEMKVITSDIIDNFTKTNVSLSCITIVVDVDLYTPGVLC